MNQLQFYRMNILTNELIYLFQKIKPGRKSIGRRSMAQNDENSTSENEIETISATPESAVDVKEVDESSKPITVNVDENTLCCNTM